MLRKVPPHDLAGRCIANGMTLGDLSERTGIPEEELLAFAAGRAGLGARDRFAILTELCEASSKMPHQALEPRRIVDHRALEAYRHLMSEVEVEDREENPE